MNYKKTLLIIGVLLLLLVPVYSAKPYADILSSALENNLQMKNAELTYQSSLLTQEKSDLSKGVKVTVTSGEVSVLPKDNETVFNKITGEFGEVVNEDISLTPSVKVELPNDGATTIEASSKLGFDYEKSGYYNTNPSLSVSHTFDLSGYDEDAVTSLNSSSTRLSSELTYQKAKISFENQLLTTISSLVSAEKSIASDEKKLSDQKQTLSDNLALGKMTESSVNYKQSKNQINLLENTIAAEKRQYETLKTQYSDLTSLTWEGVSDLPEVDLTFTQLESGNTSVILKSIASEVANENIKAKNAELNPRSVALKTGASTLLSSSDKNVSASVGVTYTQSNWSVSSTLSGSYDNEKLTPKLILSGTWSNKTTKQSDEIDLKVLSNSLLKAQNDYQDEMTNYIQSSQNLELKILQYNYKVEAQSATDEYLKADSEYQKELYDAGLATEKSVNDANFALEQNEYDKMLLAIEGLQLQNEIKQQNL